MKTTILMLAGLVSLGSLAACNRAESPSATANDVAEARQDAAKDNAEARADANKDMAKVQGGMSDPHDVNQAESKANYEVVTTRAKGDHKVAIEKCEALAGDQQKACKTRADADLDQAMADAKSAYPEH